ncbi:hypothetical protein D3C87_2124920 [compost metagenome]
MDDGFYSKLQALSMIAGPSDWSLDRETSQVNYYGMPEVGLLEPRIQMLAERYPGHFSLAP